VGAATKVGFLVPPTNAVVSTAMNPAIQVAIQDNGGNTVTSYNGDKALTFSGLAPADSGTNATVTDKDAVAKDLGQSTTNTFVNGVSSVTLVAYKGETNVTLNVHDDAETPLSSESIEGFGLTLTVANANPVTPDRTLSRAPLTSLKISVTDLMASVTDANKDNLSFDGVAYEGSASVTTSSGYVFYLPNGVTTNDTFTYTVSDGNGGSNTGTVTINVVTPGGIAKNLTVDGGSVTVKFFGIPGILYDIERTPNLDEPITWEKIATSVAPGPDGSFGLTDTSAPSPSAYYRSIQH
jgi:hypothetical protein